ncbi:hypothetical protein RIR_e4267_A0A2N1MV74_9GLOM [Rhizophagus irregularis DAOM 181602=DAOM 197198]|nr:hypothetical protein RIR_e4267_A0A2N1MV74_9GLOM [Rhizophagus irregularis DAOM 181602=DAOM 197198]
MALCLMFITFSIKVLETSQNVFVLNLNIESFKVALTLNSVLEIQIIFICAERILFIKVLSATYEVICALI